MTVTVLDHLHDRALTLGAVDSGLIVQTGTLVFEFRGAADNNWARSSLSHPVIELPARGLLGTVLAIASAAPASMSYSPPAATVAGDGERPLLAEGNVQLAGSGDGFDAGSGTVQVHVTVGGHIKLPVTANGRSPAAVLIPEAGWAIDRARAVRAGTHILLVADLAVAGPARLIRLSYTVFVTIVANLVANEPSARHL